MLFNQLIKVFCICSILQSCCRVIKTITFYNFANGGANDASVTFDGHTYSYQPHGTIGNIRDTFLNNTDYAGYGVQNAAGSWLRFDDLISTESTAGLGPDSGVIDGTYTWDAGDNKYRQ